MLNLLTAAWLCLPIAPLNPTAEDTLPAMNLHVTIGVTTPNHIVGACPRFELAYEALAVHPLVISLSADYQFGDISPDQPLGGEVHQGTLALCGIYYRGTDRLTAYLGAGPILRLGFLHLSSATRDSLWQNQQIEKVRIKPAPGYRLLLGLRVRRALSIEVAINQVTSNLVFTRRLGPLQTSEYPDEVNLSSFSITVGYIWTLRQ